ncbi:TadE family protein [Methylobacterium radiodurans]|uniref:TadE family protein n=1 Tax=Methylobacterium radiodurans TaxID=2202828 RepID=UPI0013A5A1BF|nr:TadE family protein [Methylobacterium radiodurans]
MSAVEFALVAPLMLYMGGVFFSLGMSLHAHNTISMYAREAARGLAVGYMTEAEAKQFAETRARNDLKVAVSASIDPATKGDANDRDVVVTLTIAPAEIAKLTPFGNWVPGGVRSQAVMRSIAP